MSYPTQVRLIDVGPRDGLQNEKQPVPAAKAASTTGAERSMLSAMLQLMFFWLKASLAAPNTTISSGRVAMAASKPFRLGVSTE